MDKEIKPNDQVTYRQNILGGTTNIIKTGTVVSVKGSIASVQFPQETLRREIPVTRLEKIEGRYGGRVRVNVDPLKR